jgi:PH domain/leucine-rich repeat-containing protein phosphatase
MSSEYLDRLRLFNASKNRLIALPPVNSSEDLNKLQELYLSCNTLGDSSMEVISGFPRLKVLHIAHNEIHNLSER